MGRVVTQAVVLYLVLAVLVVVQYLFVRGRGITDDWYYLAVAAVLVGLAVVTVGEVLVRGPKEIERHQMDEREVWLQARAMQIAYVVSLLAGYLLAFREALITGKVFNPVLWVFTIMAVSWVVALGIIRWRSS